MKRNRHLEEYPEGGKCPRCVEGSSEHSVCKKHNVYLINGLCLDCEHEHASPLRVYDPRDDVPITNRPGTKYIGRLPAEPGLPDFKTYFEQKHGSYKGVVGGHIDVHMHCIAERLAEYADEIRERSNKLGSVSMVEFKGSIYVASTNGVYRIVDDKLVELKFNDGEDNAEI